jgi:addiction module HigA family antidote
LLIITKEKTTMARPAIHAGEILSDELEELGISASELARSLHIPTNRITQILKGQRGITADTALRLGRWFGTGAELWLNLQKAYELRLAEELAGEEIQKTIQPRSSNNQQLVQV